MWSTDDHTKSSQGEDYSSLDKRPPLSVWRKFQWPAIFALFAISFAAGFLGFSKYYSALGQNLTHFDALYLTLQLAVLESGAVSGQVPWELELARWALPLLTTYTAILTLATIFRQQFRLIRLRFLSSHVIVCGLGEKGLRLAQLFHASGENVVAIELNVDNRAIHVCKEMGITTLVGDARDAAYLSKARVNKAKNLIIVCGDDGTNLEIAVRARELNRDRRRGTLTCALHLVSHRLYTLLRDEALGDEASPSVRLEVFNLFERGAKELIRTYPVRSSDEAAKSGYLKVMIVGLTELGKSVLVQIARDWHKHHQAPQRKLSLVVLDPRAENLVEALQRQFPRMSEACEIIPVDINLNHETALEHAVLQNEKIDSIPDIVYVLLDDHSLGFQTALHLHGLFHKETPPVIVSMTEDSGLATILHQDAGTASSRRNIYAFDILKHTCTPELILRGSHELMARAVHENYLQGQLARGEELGSRRALVPWDSLPKDLRDSNRRQVDLMRIKLERAGYGIKPLVDWDAGSKQFSIPEIELMARLEHEFWMDERMSRGWTFAPGSEDPVKKTHPNLLAWEELSEQAKDKDRQTVSSIPKILFLAGFQIYRL